MKNFFSRAQFFLLSLFVFLIPLQTVYIFRQGPIGQDGAAREGIWQFGTLAIYATDMFFLLIVVLAFFRIFLFRPSKKCHSRLDLESSLSGININTGFPPPAGGFTGMTQGRVSTVFGQSERRKIFFTEILKCIKNPMIISLVCLLCIAFLSVVWSSDKILALQAVCRLFEGMVIFFLLSRMSSARRDILAWLFIAGACIQGVFCAVQFFMQEIPAISWLGISHHASWILGDAVVESGEVRWLRAYGSFPHPNILAAYLVAGYFFCIAIVLRSEKKIQTWFATLAGSCILFGLVLTFSREAWLGLVVGLGVVGIVSCHAVILRVQPEGSRTYWQKATGFFVTLRMTNKFISPLIFFFLVSFVTIIFSGILFSEPLSVRLGIGGWKRLEVKSIEERVGSVKEFLSLGPALIRGVGIGQYTKVLYERDIKNNTVRSSYAYQPVHNAFLLVLAELGIAGFIAFVAFLFFLGRQLFYGNRNCHPDPPAGGEGSRRFQKKISGFFTSLRMTKISIAILFSFITISFFDHFFWTIHSGILLWWVGLAGLDRYFDA